MKLYRCDLCGAVVEADAIVTGLTTGTAGFTVDVNFTDLMSGGGGGPKDVCLPCKESLCVAIQATIETLTATD